MDAKFVKTYFRSIRFPVTAVGKIVKMSLDVREIDEHRQFYDVVLDKEVEGTEQVFFVEYMKSLPRGQKGKIVITFKPVVPFRSMCNFFEILERHGNHIHLVVYGESKGPDVVATSGEIIFLCDHKVKNIQKTIELINKSEIKATYHFDLDSKQGCFSVDKLIGVIPPKSHLFITVTYNNSKRGFHAAKLICLVKYQRPIIINAIALNNLHDKIDLSSNPLALEKYPFPVKSMLGYSGYFDDVSPILTYEPPFSLTQHYFDFDYVKESTISAPPLSFTITNHMKYHIKVLWDQDTQNIFTITPNQCTIDAESNAFFECTFQPNEPEKIFAAQIRGLVHWYSNLDNELKVPIPIIIRLMGHSFSPSSSGWLPQAEIVPKKIVMPSTISSAPSYATCVLKRYGHLPLLFKFIGPEITNFCIKPMQGMVTDNYQIIAIQYYPVEDKPQVDNETWYIEFNNKTQMKIKLKLHGRSEEPVVQVGNDNEVVFHPSFPRCQQGLMVKLWNKTRHKVKYEQLVPDYLVNILKIDDPVGVLVGHQCTYSLWTWTAMGKGNMSDSIILRTTALNYMGTEFGIPLENTIKIHAKTVISVLCSFPTMYSFGDVQFGIGISTNFTIFNFGEAEIHYELKADHKDFPIGNPVHDLIIYPMFGTIQPQSRENIGLTVYPNDIGYHEFKITYNIRKHMYSNEIIHCTNILLFQLNYYSQLPLLKVIDLHSTGINYLFSKFSLWQSLNMDELNDAIEKVRPYGYETVNINLPVEIIDTPESKLGFIFKNVTPYTAFWSVKRRKLCDCKKAYQKVGFSIQKLTYDCPHRKMVSMNVTSDAVEGGCTSKLEIFINYSILGSTKVAFTLELSNNRFIQFIISVNTTEPNASILFPYTSLEMNFQSIYIGDIEPFVQLFWLYNKTKETVKFTLDVDALELFNKGCESDLITCLNPQDSIKPYDSHPIMFIFKPVETKYYEVNLMLTRGNEKSRLKLCGSGSIAYNSHYYELFKKVPFVPFAPNEDHYAIISCDHLCVKPFPVNSYVERIIFLENITSAIIEFTWKSYTIPNIIRIFVAERKGSLQPYEKRAIKICLKSKNLPCIVTNTVLVCETANLTKRRFYEKKKIEYSLECSTLQDQFTISETGWYKAEPQTKIPPPPKISFISLTVSCIIEGSTKSIDIKESVKDQKKAFPSPEMVLHADNTISPGFHDEIFEVIPPKQIKLIQQIMELAVMDIIKADQFKTDIQHAQSQLIPYYTQIRRQYQSSRILVKRIFACPKHRLIATVLNKMVFENIENLFRIEPLENMQDTYRYPSSYRVFKELMAKK